MAEEFTAKFRVDISDLKKNITEANKQIRTANATFKSQTAGMDNWAKDASGLTAKLKQLDSTLEGQKSILSSYKKQLDEEKKAYKENGARVDELKAKLKELSDKGVKKTDEEYKKYSTALKDITEEQNKNGKSIESLNLKILNQEGAVKKTEAQIEKYTQAQKNLEKEENSLTDRIARQESELESLRKEYIDVASAEGKASAEAQEMAKKIKKLSSELEDNRKKANDAEKEFEQLSDAEKEAGDSAEQSSDGYTTFKGVLSNLISDVITTGIQKLKDLALETFNAGSNFEAAMSQVEAISGATGDELIALTNKAKEMGAKTKYSASESAEAFNYMAMAGWKTEDMLNGIEGIMNLAAASGEDLATTSDIVTDALTAMGYSAGDAGKLADVMAAASSNANTNVHLMGETFQYAAAVAGSMGYSMEDVAVTTGLMANAGIKGTKAGTALRSIITRLSTDAGASSKQLGALGILTEKLGVQFYNADGSARDFGDVINETRKKWKGLTAEEQTNYASKIAGKNAIAGWLSIMNAAEGDVNKLTNAVNKSTGASQKMANVMQNNVQGTMTKLKSQIEGVQIQIFEKLAPAFQSGLKEAQKFVKGVNWDKFGNTAKGAFNKLLSVLKWLIKNAGTVTTVLKIMIAAFVVKKIWDFTKGISDLVLTFAAFIAKIVATTAAEGGLTAAQTALNVAMSSNPVGIVVAALGALVAIIGVAISSTSQLTEEEEKEKQKTEELTSAINAQKASIDELEKTKSNTIAASDIEIQKYQDLWDELTKITDENGNVKDGYKKRAEFITNELSQALGTEISLTDGVVQKYKEIGGKIDELIKKKKGKIILDAQEEGYKEAITKQAEATNQLATAQTELNNKRKEANNKFLNISGPATKKEIKDYAGLLNEIQILENDIAKNGPGVQGHKQDWLDNLNETKRQYDEFIKQYQENYNKAEAAVKQYAYNISQYQNNQLLYQQEKYDEMSTATYEYYDKTVKAGTDAADAEKAQQEQNLKTTTLYYEILLEEKKRSGSSMYDDQIAEQEKILNSQISGLSAYNKATKEGLNANKLVWSENLDENLALITGENLEFKKVGENSYQYYNDGVLQESGKTYTKEQILKIIEKNYLQPFKDEEGKYNEAGRFMIQGLNNGFTDKQQQSVIFDSVKALVKGIIAQIQGLFDMHSPSRVMFRLALNVGRGFINGIKAMTKPSVKVARDYAKSVLNAMDFSGVNNFSNGLSFINKEMGDAARSFLINSPNGGSYVTKTQNFYQTINAPQTPSRYELYRQTKNLLSLAERGV